MKYINIIPILMLLLVTGCNITDHVEKQADVVNERAEDTEKEESILQKETTENDENLILQENSTENVQEESFKEIVTIAAEDVVYEEDDVVFVIKKDDIEKSLGYYGYLISAGGKVVPYYISFDEFYSEEISCDYDKILNMETAEPIMFIEKEVMQQYIDMLKNVDENNEIIKKPNNIESLFEHKYIWGRKIDKDKRVELVQIYYYENIISDPTDPNAIEIMNWLLELDNQLTQATTEG